MLTLGFTSLGVWQLRRLAWKEALIAQVDARVHAAPVDLPNAADDSLARPGGDSAITTAVPHRIGDAALAYLHVRVRGHYLWEKTTRVQGTSDLGMGFWVLTPLRRPDNGLVMVNRGFLTAEQARRVPVTAPYPRCAAAMPVCEVTGLVRLSEPGGTALRANQPAAGRWFSRDIAAIARAQGLPPLPPLFIDADADPATNREGTAAVAAADQPVGGLTVVQFSNNHLGYALTWFALALLTPVATAIVLRERQRMNVLASADPVCDTADTTHHHHDA